MFENVLTRVSDSMIGERLGGRGERRRGMFWRDGSNVYKVERGEN